MSNLNEAFVGDIILTANGSLVLLTETNIDRIDTVNQKLESYHLGLQLPHLHRVKVSGQHRRVCSIAELLKLGEDHGLDFRSLPEPQLSEAEQQARRIQSLERQLAALEAANKN
jgi:hypothetical protein